MRSARWVAVAVLGVMCAAAFAPTASADTLTQGGCPGGYERQTVDYVLGFAAPGFADAIRAMDRNGDESLCFKLLPDQNPLFEPYQVFLYYDNQPGLGSRP